MYEGLKRGVRPFVGVLPIGRNGIGVFKVLSRNCKLYEFREISPLPPCAPPQQRRGPGRTQEFDECPPKHIEYLRRRAGGFVARRPWESIDITVRHFYLSDTTSVAPPRRNRWC